MQEERQLGGSLVGALVGPFAQDGLGQTLGLSFVFGVYGFVRRCLILSIRSALAYRWERKLTPLPA
jgi:hypothetical protein